MDSRFLYGGMLSIGLAGFFAVEEYLRQSFETSADVIFILLSGSCTLLALTVVRRMGWRGIFGRVYFGFFAAIFLVFLGNVSDGIYDALRAATPFPSFSDVLYLLGYTVAFVTLLRFLWFFRKAVDRERMLRLVALFIISSSGIIGIFLLSHTVTEVPLLALGALYPILDIFSVTLSIAMLVFFRSRFISPPWRWFALGVLLMGIGHFLNGIGTAEGWYSYPQPLDLFYLWGYVSLALGFSMQTKPEVFWE